MRSSARPSPMKLSGSASSGPATSRATSALTTVHPATAAAGSAGRGLVGGALAGRYLHPTCCINSTASGSRLPASSTSIGSILTSAQSRMWAAGGTVRVGRQLAVLHDRLLGLGAGEVLHEANRVRAVLGALDEPDPGEVGVRARAVLVRPGGRDREVRVVGELAAEVVVVGEADVAAVGRDRLEHVDVGAEDLRVVGHPGAQQLLGRRVAALGQHVGDERLVVLVVARAQAQAAAPALVAEVGVGLQGVLGHALGRAHHRADPQAHRPPGAVGVPQLAGHVALERRRGHVLQQPRLLRAPEVGEVGRDQQVGGRVGALAAQALEELRRGAAAQLDVEPGVLLEGQEGLLVAVLRAPVVDHDVGGSAHRHDGGAEQRTATTSAPTARRQCRRIEGGSILRSLLVGNGIRVPSSTAAATHRMPARHGRRREEPAAAASSRRSPPSRRRRDEVLRGRRGGRRREPDASATERSSRCSARAGRARRRCCG